MKTGFTSLTATILLVVLYNAQHYSHLRGQGLRVIHFTSTKWVLLFI